MAGWLGSMVERTLTATARKVKKAWVFSYSGSARAIKSGSPPMTSRTASGAKLKDGLESKHHCKIGVSLPCGRMRRYHRERPSRHQGSFISVLLKGICFGELTLESGGLSGS